MAVGWKKQTWTYRILFHCDAAILQGDYRLLYLVWLKEMTFFGEPVEDEGEDSRAYDIEPPVPPGLKKLDSVITYTSSEPLISIRFWFKPPLKAAPICSQPHRIDYREYVSHLSRAECDDFLVRLANGDATAGMALRKRLSELFPQSQPPQAPVNAAWLN